MIGKTLVTVQTGPPARVVNRLYVEDGSQIERELYLSALVDRATSRVAFIISTGGRHEYRGSRARHAGKNPSP